MVMKSRRVRWSRHVARVGERRGEYRILVGKPEWKRTWRPRRRWSNDIKMDLKKVGCVAQTRLIWLRMGTVDGRS
jgi:hypothetical protein